MRGEINPQTFKPSAKKIIQNEMKTNVQVKVDRLNQLYHRIITQKGVDKDEELFRNLVKQLKSWGYKFRLITPEFDPPSYELNDYESKLFSRLELVRLEKKHGAQNQLYTYSHMMRDCEKYLYRAIFVSLCMRGILEKVYFQIEETSNWIDFIQSGHRIDVYVLF